ncbi:Outer membrane protein OmpA [Marivirga sericea]|uniref:Outer membrane protein OmpA n=1 Tax=Marivirga sericea TaxID=1028 RepID=A0A1X7IHJ8_9BACT|nr:OmpA family protein [Marivirga sericea]SMG13725.1 Outer membrane protein OmpA [Marivirga sericea]
MKYFLLLFLCCTSPLFLSAQTHYLMQEDFTSPSYTWQFQSDSNAQYHYDGQHLSIDRSHQTDRFATYTHLAINPKTDYKIEALVKQTKGGNTGSYGIHWGSHFQSRSTFSFIINSSGSFKIYSSWGKRIKEFTAWRKSAAIRGKGQNNKLTIHKRKETIFFSINEKEVAEIRASKVHFQGGRIGLVLNGDIGINVDYFHVLQDKSAINQLANQPAIIKEKLPYPINTEAEELMPIVSYDGKSLYFTRNEHDEQAQEIWKSTLEDEQWGAPIKLGFPLNTPGHNNVMGISTDNSKLILSNTYSEDGLSLTHNGYSMTEWQDDHWSIPKKVKISSYINSSNIAETSLSVTGKSMVLSLKTGYNEGMNDLYLSNYTSYIHSWSGPRTLGKVVNSFGNESAPFLAADGKTLYFSSEGHSGYGDMDIFMSRMLDDRGYEWSEPINLGPEINTPKWDGYFSIPAKGDWAYMVSQSDGAAQLDIYRVKVPEALKPDPVVLIKGRVLDANTKKPLHAQLYFESLPKGRRLNAVRSKGTDGSYQIILPYGEHYGYYTQLEGYLSTHDNIDLQQKENYQEITRDIYLSPLSEGSFISLNNVYFGQGSYEILEASHPELDRLIRLMRSSETMEIEIGGHTERRGSARLNKILSQDRADAVKAYLVQAGIDEKRIKTKGYGSSKPITDGTTEKERKQNRRVEYTILSL